MSLLDLLLGIIVVTSIIGGWMAGFARVGIGFCAAIAGLLFGFWMYGVPAAWFHKFVSSDTAANFLGFFTIFFGCLMLGAIIGKIVSKLFRWTGLSWLDRLLGAGFGFVRGAFIGAVFVAVLLAFTPRPMPNWMIDSKLLPYGVEASDAFTALAPAALKGAFHQGLDEIRKDWDAALKESQHRGEAEKKSSKKGGK